LAGAGGAVLKGIAIVIVSWESGDELVACVASLAQARNRAGAEGARIELVIVDNASERFPREAIERLWPDVVLEINPVNRGFAAAANQGAARTSAPVVLFLNPDTRAEDEPFAPLRQAFADRPDAVAVAPRLLEAETAGAESQADFQLRRLPSLMQAVRELSLFDRAFPANRFRRRDRYADRNRQESFEVEQPAAAALAVRRAEFFSAGGFDERFSPAWFEDVDLCARLLERGRILYYPASRFTHRGGAAARHLGYDRFLPIYYRNALRYFAKNRGPWRAAVYRALLLCGMPLRLALLPFRPNPPRSRRAAARAYGRVIAGALGLGWPP
jgi:N-acetylglucosaminyl-diphospho-decaprenol L-rhamnosyltransferase